MLKHFFCLLFCSCFFLLASAQEYRLRNIYLREGLPSLIIYKTVEDSLGYIWLATSRGIFRYDGTHFRSYEKEKGLTENAFFYAGRMPQSNTLFFISNTFKVFVYRNGQFKVLPYDHLFCWMDFDEQHRPHFLTRHGNVYRYEGDSIVPLSTTTDRTIHYAIAYAGRQEFIVSSITGMDLISATGQRRHLLRDTSMRTNGLNYRSFTVKGNRVLTASPFGIYEYDSNSRSVHMALPFNDVLIYCIRSSEKNNDLLVGNNKGLWLFRDGILDLAHREIIISEQHVSDVFQNREQVYIFSTLRNGFYLSTLASLHYGKKEGLIETNMRFVRNFGKEVYAFSENADVYFLANHKANLIPAKQVFRKPNTADVILPTANGLFMRLQLHQWIRVNAKKLNKIREWTMAEVHIDDSLSLVHLISTRMANPEKGVDISDAYYEAIAPFTKVHAVKPEVGHLLLVDRKGKRYYHLKEKGYIIQSATDPEKLIHKDLGSDLDFMLKVNDHLVVAGTQDKGLAWIRNDSLITFLDMQSGLPGNHCIRIQKLGNELWVMTDKGLSKVIVSATNGIGSITNFTDNNELADEAPKDFCVWGDTVFVAGEHGIATFSRNRSFVPQDPNVNISTLQINNRDTLVSGQYELAYDMNNITVTYNYPSLLSAGKTLYRYILTRNGDTINMALTNEERLQFFSLSSGTYILSLAAMDANNTWSSAPARILFHIRPVFWKTWWFIAGTSLLFAGLLAALFLYRLRVSRNESLMKNRIIASELKVLRLHMNPHFIFNTLNSLQRFVLKGDPLTTNEYIAKFSRLFRWIMEYSDKQQISLQEELDFLNLYIELEQLRFQEAFRCRIDLPENINVYTTYIPPLVIQPFVENAVKYGLSGKSDGLLEIRFQVQGDLLAVIVHDNGVGRDKVRHEQERSGKETKSTGIRYTEERLKLLMGNDHINPVIITDLYEQGKPAGTQVSLLIPMLT